MSSFARIPGGRWLAGLRRFAVAPITVFGVGLAVITSLFALGLTLNGVSLGPVWAILVLGGFSILAERRPVRVNQNVELTVSILPVAFAAVVFGPLSAMAVGAIGLVVTFRPPYIRWLIWTCTRAIGAGLAGVVAGLVMVEDASAGRLFAAVALAALCDSVFDAALGAIVVAIRRSGDSVGGLRLLRPILMGTVPLYTPIIVLLVYVYQEFSTWSLLLFLVPAFAAHRLHGLYREQRQTAEQLSVANRAFGAGKPFVCDRLVAALDARDQYTAGHSAAVAVYARDIAVRLGSPMRINSSHICVGSSTTSAR